MAYFYIILLLIIIFYFKYANTKVIYYSSDELVNKLHYIFRDYYYYMSEENLKLRNINNTSKYLNKIHQSFYTTNAYEKKIITDAVHKADEKIKKLGFIGFNPSKLKYTPWIFGFSKGTEYEFGLPHTQDNIIILNKDNIYI